MTSDPFAAASGQVTGADLITKVKAAVRIESWFPDRQKSSGDGRWYAAKCPFHDDKNPSFWIDTRKQLCGCESCRMLPMDAINLYARMHKVSDAIAVTELGRLVGVVK
jgi:DNA primase